MKEIISSIGKLNHIAIAVPSIQIASDMWKKALGANISAPQILTDHGVKVIFVEAPNTKVELFNFIKILMVECIIFVMKLKI